MEELVDTGPLNDTPLYTEAVRGIRCWVLAPDERDGGHLLTAAGQSHVWRPGAPEVATCRLSRRRSRVPHLAPHPECTCGIYAFHPESRDGHAQAERMLADGRGRVTGMIAAWGNLELHLDGFRAEWAVPEVLFVRDPDEVPVICAVAEKYGARVVELTNNRWLRLYARRQKGISLATARRHVLEEMRIELEPMSEVFEGGDEFVVKSGFACDSQALSLMASEKLLAAGLGEFKVAGVSYRAEALQADAFAPGNGVALVPEPENPHDANAIGVWDSERKVQAGYVPARLARRLGRALDRDEIRRALVVTHTYGQVTMRRSGLRILVAPTNEVSS